MRKNNRKFDEMRTVEIKTNIQKDPAGSIQIAYGNTVVLCSASVENKQPIWMKEDNKKGWITAEYAMLPGATQTRNSRKQGGRAKEIQRLIGRSLRASVDLKKLYPYTITVDCDVIQADAGTRTASVTGGWLAMAIAIKKLMNNGKLKYNPLKQNIAAVSVVLQNGEILLDPDYNEDSSAQTDMNFVITDDGKFVEIQGTAEQAPFDEQELNKMIIMAKQAVSGLIKYQNKILQNI